MKKSYLVVSLYDKRYKKITNSKLVSDWWHYLPGMFIVVSESNPEELRKNMFRNKDVSFIAEINLDNTCGLLPNPAWEWIFKHSKSKNRKLGKTIKKSFFEWLLGE